MKNLLRLFAVPAFIVVAQVAFAANPTAQQSPQPQPIPPIIQPSPIPPGPSTGPVDPTPVQPSAS
jgi:hypothetical protein